jgi:phospholipase C
MNLRFHSSAFVLLLVPVLSILGSVGCGSTSASSNQSPDQIVATFVANPTSVAAGEFTTFTWMTTGAVTVDITPTLGDDDDGSQLPMSGSRTLVPTQTTTYVMTATAKSGVRKTMSVTVTVTAAKPTITMTASPESLLAGQSATLQWASTNATSIEIDQGVGTFTKESGSVQVKPTSTTTYTATAKGNGGTSTASVTITIAASNQLAVSLTAAPLTISAGGKSQLTWSSQNAASVRIDPQIGPVNLSGTLQIAPANTTTYVATATDAAGATKTASVTVTFLGGNAADLSNIKHIIFFIQENRTFDNYFGVLDAYRKSKGVPSDIDGFDPDLAMVDFYGHSVKPYHQRSVRTDNLTPSWNESHFYANYQKSTFKMNSWMKQSTPSIPSNIDPHYTRTMGYYDCTDIPFYCAVATQFATSDRFCSSVMSGTIVNRTYLLSATSVGMIRPSNAFPVEAPTIFRRLSEAGITWRYYYQDGSVFLANYTKPGGCDNCDWDRFMKNAWQIKNYYDILLRSTADHDLPQVVFIEHSSGEDGDSTALDEHPGHDVQRGVASAEKIIRALMNSPAWPSSVFILSHDEGGGLYDHVAPYSVPAPDATLPERNGTDGGKYDNFTFSGFRVPLLVISPWVKPHFVSHTNREFTSILKLIETRFNLQPLTDRDAAADDMTEFFDFSTPHLLVPPELPVQPVACPLPITSYGDKNGNGLIDGNEIALPDACNKKFEASPTHQ